MTAHCPTTGRMGPCPWLELQASRRARLTGWTWLLWLHLAGGIVLDRHYEIGRDSETFLDADADNAWFLRTGITMR